MLITQICKKLIFLETIQTYWLNCLSILRENLTPSAFQMWFAPIVPVSYKDSVLVLQVKSEYVVRYIEENYIDILSKALLTVFSDRNLRLEYRVLIDSTGDKGSIYPSEQMMQRELIKPEYEQKSKPAYQAFSELPPIDSQLNTKYMFTNFVVGDSNKLARTAGMSISNDPGKTIFNPLFIYGGSGVGKTHLVNAIGNQVKQKYPEKRVLYVSANTFQVQYTQAVVSNKVNEFINFYQTIDVLIVDDIQYWSEKKGTQNTFFFIFNHLHQTGKQLILTSDCAPVDLKGLEERLITRFKWGLSCELKKPDYNLRRDILKSRIYLDGLSVSDEIVNYIAENVHDNVRDLEGVLASLLAYSMLMDTDINMDLAKEVVSKSVAVSAGHVTIDNISQAVCDHFGVPEKLIFTASRKHEVAIARQVAMYLAKKLTDKPLAEIGLKMGNRNHATVLHAIKTVNETMEFDPVLRRSVQQLENRLIN